VRLPLPVASTTDCRPATRHPTGPPISRSTLCVAHRGASHEAPENTLVAVRRAVALAADLVEVDVQRSRDGALVLMHDTTLTRTTDARERYPRRAPWRVGDLTLDELRRLDAGSWKSPAFAGERVPTLDELLDVLEPTRTGVLLELKAPELYTGVSRDLASALRSRPRLLSGGEGTRRLVVESFHYAAVKELKTLLPSVPVGLLGTPARSNLPALATWADQVNPSHYSVDGSYVDLVHRLGMECQVWTVNRRAAMRRVLRMGVDGVITNRPDVLGDVIRTTSLPDRGGRTAARRRS
jgi:glycerophosphoryl diester phosphodiesterase